MNFVAKQIRVPSIIVENTCISKLRTVTCKYKRSVHKYIQCLNKFSNVYWFTRNLALNCQFLFNYYYRVFTGVIGVRIYKNFKTSFSIL